MNQMAIQTHPTSPGHPAPSVRRAGAAIAPPGPARGITTPPPPGPKPAAQAALPPSPPLLATTKPKKDYSKHIGEDVRCESCSYWTAIPGKRMGLCSNFSPLGSVEYTEQTHADFGCRNFKELPMVVQGRSISAISP